jgi:KaiC/GvpD/RAD55 family RecA-like ATPase
LRNIRSRFEAHFGFTSANLRYRIDEQLRGGIREQQLTEICGASGAGKTQVSSAGLIVN